MQYGWDKNGREVLFFTPELKSEGPNADPWYFPFWGSWSMHRPAGSSGWGMLPGASTHYPSKAAWVSWREDPDQMPSDRREGPSA